MAIYVNRSFNVAVVVLALHILLEQTLVHCLLKQTWEHEDEQIQLLERTATYLHVHNVHAKHLGEHVVNEEILLDFLFGAVGEA